MRTTLLVCSAALLAACGADTSTALDPRLTAAAMSSTQVLDQHGDDGEPVLLARAIYPADRFQPGPASGAFITGDNGAVPPFPGQPIPGFSAVLDIGDGSFWAMPDNGFGAKDNSGDFLLRLYHVRPDFKTARGGSGSVGVIAFIQLRDPDHKIPFTLFRADRLLTGADFDLESVRRARDGPRSGSAKSSARFCCTSAPRGRCSRHPSRFRASCRRRIPSCLTLMRGRCVPAAASKGWR